MKHIKVINLNYLPCKDKTYQFNMEIEKAFWRIVIVQQQLKEILRMKRNKYLRSMENIEKVKKFKEV